MSKSFLGNALIAGGGAIIAGLAFDFSQAMHNPPAVLSQTKTTTGSGALPLGFEATRGQVDSRVNYFTLGQGYNFLRQPATSSLQPGFGMLFPLDAVDAATDPSAIATARMESTAVKRQSELRASYSALPLSFELNQGQTNGPVKFLARAGGYLLFLTPTEAVMALDNAAAHRKAKGDRDELVKTDNEPRPPRPIVRMKLEGANPAPLVEGLEELRAGVTTSVALTRPNGTPTSPVMLGYAIARFIPGSIWSITGVSASSSTTL